MPIDIKNFYLNTPMARYKYMRLKIAELPQDFIYEYMLHDKTKKYGYVYLEIRKGMYGLPQAGTLAKKLPKNDRIQKITGRAASAPVFGNMTGAQFSSAYAWTIPGLNMWTGNTTKTS